MIEHNGEEAGAWAFEHTNVPAEINRIKRLVAANITEQRIPTLDDIKKYIDQGYLVRVGINCRKLDNEEGFVGHAVVITGYDNSHLIFHDPGSEPVPNRKATYDEFEAAWADPSSLMKELDAIKLRT